MYNFLLLNLLGASTGAAYYWQLWLDPDICFFSGSGSKGPKPWGSGSPALENSDGRTDSVPVQYSGGYALRCTYKKVPFKIWVAFFHKSTKKHFWKNACSPKEKDWIFNNISTTGVIFCTKWQCSIVCFINLNCVFTIFYEQLKKRS